MEIELTTETILQEAARLAYGTRREEYGGIKEGMVYVADLWNAYLRNRPNGFDGIGPRDVAAMMVLLKIARLPTCVKRDTWVDIAGYAAVGADVDEV